MQLLETYERVQFTNGIAFVTNVQVFKCIPDKGIKESKVPINHFLPWLRTGKYRRLSKCN
ncbi:hypothetical protein pVco7_gp040 [Vibrio phage pVco-7]|uniref:Uncharacterized protein n=1 Tax=Vibrio phage pVco-5 TaxID=1965485 RepID=A0A1W6JUS8_9CAUD|nr:hypothetical protein KNT61_gp041 [Vibrio phage pVco-5]ARM71029.1 hypothetical protein pVco5_041 [Vibrio phage pVco-5]